MRKHMRKRMKRRLLDPPVSGLKAKATAMLPDDWILNVPHGKWFVISNEELVSLQIRRRREANCLKARWWGFSSVLKSQQLVAMLSSELPNHWPSSWYLEGRPIASDGGDVRLIRIEMKSKMDCLSEHHPDVNVAIL